MITNAPNKKMENNFVNLLFIIIFIIFGSYGFSWFYGKLRRKLGTINFIVLLIGLIVGVVFICYLINRRLG